MNTYTIQVKCSNCDHIGPTEIPKGTPVPDQLVCPNCSCETAKKYNAVSSLPLYEKKDNWPWPPRIWTEPDRTWTVEPIEPHYPFKVICESDYQSTPCCSG